MTVVPISFKGSHLRTELGTAGDDSVHLQAGWTADDEAVLQQLRPFSDDGSTAQYPPLLMIANKCDLAAPSSCSDLPTADSIAVDGVPIDAESATNGAVPLDSQAAAPHTSSQAAPPTEALMPDAARFAASAVVRTSAKTGEGLEALKRAVLTLTDTPQLAAGVRQPSVVFSLLF